MSAALPSDLQAARAALDHASAHLARARTLLDDTAGRALRLIDETAWETPAARGFRERASEWHRDVARLAADADRARDLLWWARSEVEAAAWASGA